MSDPAELYWYGTPLEQTLGHGQRVAVLQRHGVYRIDGPMIFPWSVTHGIINIYASSLSGVSVEVRAAERRCKGKPLLQQCKVCKLNLSSWIKLTFPKLCDLTLWVDYSNFYSFQLAYHASYGRATGAAYSSVCYNINYNRLHLSLPCALLQTIQEEFTPSTAPHLFPMGSP